MLPQGVFSVAVSTVLFPTLARFAARGSSATCGRRWRTACARSCCSPRDRGDPLCWPTLWSGSCTSAASSTPADRSSSPRRCSGSRSRCRSTACFLLTRTFFSLQRPWVPAACREPGDHGAVLPALLPGPSGWAGSSPRQRSRPPQASPRRGTSCSARSAARARAAGVDDRAGDACVRRSGGSELRRLAAPRRLARTRPRRANRLARGRARRRRRRLRPPRSRSSGSRRPRRSGAWCAAVRSYGPAQACTPPGRTQVNTTSPLAATPTL